jgi:hypothetical protein
MVEPIRDQWMIVVSIVVACALVAWLVVTRRT